jgi:hypothetical protein
MPHEDVESRTAACCPSYCSKDEEPTVSNQDPWMHRATKVLIKVTTHRHSPHALLHKIVTVLLILSAGKNGSFYLVSSMAPGRASPRCKCRPHGMDQGLCNERLKVVDVVVVVMISRYRK